MSLQLDLVDMRLFVNIADANSMTQNDAVLFMFILLFCGSNCHMNPVQRFRIRRFFIEVSVAQE